MSTAMAKSATALVVVRGQPATFPVAMTNPPPPASNGAARDLTGSTITALLATGAVQRPVTVLRTSNGDTLGQFKFSIAANDTGDLPPVGLDPRVILTVTDPQGGVVIAVYPLISQLP